MMSEVIRGPAAGPSRVLYRRNKRRLIRLALVGAIVLATGAVAPAQQRAFMFAQEAPPAPIIPRLITTFPVSTVPAQYQMVMEMVDFAPGAGTPEYAYFGRAFVTVLEGTLTYKSGDEETALSAGPDGRVSPPPVTWFRLHNGGNVSARALITVLLLPDSPLMVVNRSSQAPANGPIIVHSARIVTPLRPGAFIFVQGIVEFPEGSGSPRHCHRGTGMSIVLTGETVNTLGSSTLVQRPGEVLEDVPGRPAQHLNRSSAPATVAIAYLQPASGPATIEPSAGGGCPAA